MIIQNDPATTAVPPAAGTAERGVHYALYGCHRAHAGAVDIGGARDYSQAHIDR